MRTYIWIAPPRILTLFSYTYSKREDAEQRKIMQENYPDTDIFLVHSARNHALWNAYIAEKWKKMGQKNTENVGYTLQPAWNLHPILHPKSTMYKGSFNVWWRKCRRFFKNFFREERRNGFLQDMGNWKHRTSLIKTSVLSRQNIGTFPQRSPMFLVSGRATDICSAGIHHRNF